MVFLAYLLLAALVPHLQFFFLLQIQLFLAIVREYLFFLFLELLGRADLLIHETLGLQGQLGKCLLHVLLLVLVFGFDFSLFLLDL